MRIARTLVLIFSAMSFIIVIGGAVYEHAAVVPVWTAAPPASLTMFQGEYALAAFRFWIPIHPITILLLVSALVLNWRTRRRKFILATLAGYAAVLVVTFLYFVPELVSIIQTVHVPTPDPELTSRAKFWETMSLVRLASMLVMALILLFGLSVSDEQVG